MTHTDKDIALVIAHGRAADPTQEQCVAFRISQEKLILEHSKEIAQLTKERGAMREALSEVASSHGKYLIGRCCVDSTCGENCDYSIGSYKAFQQCAVIALHALAAINKEIK